MTKKAQKPADLPPLARHVRVVVSYSCPAEDCPCTVTTVAETNQGFFPMNILRCVNHPHLTMERAEPIIREASSIVGPDGQPKLILPSDKGNA